MKNNLLIFAIIVSNFFIASGIFSCCYDNDSKKCFKDRFQCIATSLFEASCCVMSKQLFKPSESISGKDYCLAMWFPTNSCDNRTDAIGTVYQWTTTGCIFLAGIQVIASLLPCIKETCYKKIKNNCCCCCPRKLFFCKECTDDSAEGDPLNN